MTAPVDSKFSLFQDAGDLIAGDIVVGLRGGVNSRFTNTGGVGVFLPLLGGTMLGAIDMGGFKITNLDTPTDPADAVTKTYADLMLPLAGGTMSGIINMNSHKITNLTDPTSAQDAATKAYVDSTGSGTVSPGLINQLAWYAAGGSTVSGLTIANSASLVTNGSGVPAWQTLTAGQILIGTTDGAPAAAAINSGSGILVGNASGSITVNLAAIADHTLLANISGGSAAPSSTTLTALIDNAIGNTQGNILYRNGSVWTVLAPSTSGFALVTGGPAANPAWAAVGAAYTASALSKGDDTNVTLTLTGTPSTALLQATTITAGWTGQLGLTRGGTASSLTASNGGIVYSTASALAILGGTATANLPLLSGSSTTPSWGSFALSLGGALTTAGAHTLSGAFASTFTFTNTTTVTFPTSGTLATTAQLPSPAALSKADDTNVTLTLTGTPTTALLQATTITAGWTGQLGLTRGGTAASLTADNGGILYSTASALAIKASTSTAGLALLSGSSTTPTWSTLPPITKVITQTFNGNGTYTPTAGMKYCIIEVLGSGAGGGGVAGTIAQAGAASGGGAGGYAKGLFTAAQVGATAAVTVGAAGAAGTSGNNNGGNGNTSSVALTGSGTITIQATGGTGGLGSGSTATFATQLGQNGGVGSNGDLNVAGQGGGAGFSFGAQPLGVSGPGGSSIYGAGGLSNASGGAASAGVAGRSFGSGGSGAASGNGTSAAGGAGTIGIVYITEYVSI